MPAILPSIPIDSDKELNKRFMKHQVSWILAEDRFHEQSKPVFALAEKSVRIGWTYADAFKNLRKRLRFPKRDYLFATKDYASALEYVRTAYTFCEVYDFTRAITCHGEEVIKVNRLDQDGRQTSFTEDVKVGFIKFQNGSRIIAFSASPQAMAVYGGDVGLDEFAKHQNAELLWETAQGRVAWNYDAAVWSAHDGDGTVFYRFAQDAKAGRSPWNLYFRVTMPDALDHGLIDIINQTRKSNFTADEFLANCRARSIHEQIFQQAYMCNPAPAAEAIVDWNTIERCRFDYEIERVHLESRDVISHFGELHPDDKPDRERQIQTFLRATFPKLLASTAKHRLGFDVAASGTGDLAVMYIDEVKANDLWLQALFSCRTEDWHFMETVLAFFLRNIRSIEGAGDESGLGRQICWNAARQFPGKFSRVNFTSRKHDLGFAIMNQLAVAQKRFPRSHQDIAADYSALRKHQTAKGCIFTESRNLYNEASHCDIAWAGALATEAHNTRTGTIGSRLG